MLAESSLSGRLWAIATYEGSRLDTFLNWTMLYLTLLAFAERARCTMPKRRARWALMVPGLAVLQVVICFAADAVGISVVWNALLAFSWVHYKFKAVPAVLAPFNRVDVLRLASVAGLALNVYYAVTEPPISTVAHVLSWVLGALLAAADKMLSSNSSQSAAQQTKEKKNE